MSQNILINNKQLIASNSIQDDVAPHENDLTTDLPSIVKPLTENFLVLDNKTCGAVVSNNNNSKILRNQSKDSSSGDCETKDNDKTNLCMQINPVLKKKRRRRKSKRSNNYLAYGRTAWKFQVTRAQENRRRLKMLTLVPYNTNKFLMEDHMPECDNTPPRQRTRDSSFSVDSDENYFFSLPEEEEEFLTKEFSSVYEDARVERLEGLSKPQLIQEYLQLQANFDQLSRRYNSKIKDEDLNNDPIATIQSLEAKVSQLSAENIELKRKSEGLSNDQMDSSEDSESDSSSSSSSSSSSCSSASDRIGDCSMVLKENENAIENGSGTEELMDFQIRSSNNSIDSSPNPQS